MFVYQAKSKVGNKYFKKNQKCYIKMLIAFPNLIKGHPSPRFSINLTLNRYSNQREVT